MAIRVYRNCIFWGVLAELKVQTLLQVWVSWLTTCVDGHEESRVSQTQAIHGQLEGRWYKVCLTGSLRVFLFLGLSVKMITHYSLVSGN